MSVKNFILKEKCSPEQRGKAPENLGNTQNSENHNSRIVKTTNQELPESQFKNDENHTSRIVEITTQEVPNSQSNNTDINNTDFNETDFNEIDSIQSYLSPSAGEVRPVGEDVIERMETYRALIQENIDYECFLDRREKEDVDELIELMVEILMMPDDSVVRIGGADKPLSVVKSRFLKLHITIHKKHPLTHPGKSRPHIRTARRLPAAALIIRKTNRHRIPHRSLPKQKLLLSTPNTLHRMPPMNSNHNFNNYHPL